MPLENVKSQRGKPKLNHEGYLYYLLRKNDRLKTWICDKKTVQSHCNNVRRQRFDDNKTLAWSRYEAFGATEGFGKDERDTSKILGLEVLVVLVKEVNRCFQSFCGISSKTQWMVTGRQTTTLKAGIEPSNWAWGSLTQRERNSCSNFRKSRASLKTSLQEYKQ